MLLSTIVGIGPFLSIAHNMVPPHFCPIFLNEDNLNAHMKSVKYSFEYLTNTVYKIREIGLNAIELLGLEHSCQLLVMWFRLLLELIKTGYTDNFGKSQNY